MYLYGPYSCIMNKVKKHWIKPKSFQSTKKVFPFFTLFWHHTYSLYRVIASRSQTRCHTKKTVVLWYFSDIGRDTEWISRHISTIFENIKKILFVGMILKKMWCSVFGSSHDTFSIVPPNSKRRISISCGKLGCSLILLLVN
jgi:hypothetical protein